MGDSDAKLAKKKVAKKRKKSKDIPDRNKMTYGKFKKSCMEDKNPHIVDEFDKNYQNASTVVKTTNIDKKTSIIIEKASKTDKKSMMVINECLEVMVMDNDTEIAE